LVTYSPTLTQRPATQGPERTGARVSSGEMLARGAAFVVPLLIGVEINALATVYLSELMLFGLLPILLVLRGRALLSPLIGWILGLGLVYLAAQVATDLVRDAPFSDFARGWSRILFLLASFVSLYLLIAGKRARIIAFALGLAAGATLYLIATNPIANIGWKFGFAGPVTVALLVSFAAVPMLSSPKSLLAPLLIMLLGGLSVLLDFRSWGGILLLSAAFLAVPAALQWAGVRPRPLSVGALVAIGLVLLTAGLGGIKLYSHAARSGWLGEKSQAKYEAQAALGDFGILLGGRSESLVTVQAIQDSPLLGHGSWAKNRRYAELRQQLLYQLGFTNRYIPPDTDLIPTHSHLLGSWVEAGIGGAVFWAGILVLIVGALRRLYASDDPIRPYLVFLMFLFIWDILFSPFGAQRRLTNGFLMVAVLYALQVRLVAAGPVRDPLSTPLAGEQVVLPDFREARPAMGGALAEQAAAWRAERETAKDMGSSDEPLPLTEEVDPEDLERIRSGFRRLRERER
jgi:hypothetical protein